MPFDISTGRPATLASNGMVTSPHSLASSAGVDVLRAGGSAIDAAIAASAVLAVVYPHMTGIGGDAFWLIHDGADGEISYLNGGGKAASGASLAALRERGLREIPLKGIIPATLTVPGAVASWIEAHERHGRLPLPRVLEAAIGYAREGFPVTARLAAFIDMMRDDLAASIPRPPRYCFRAARHRGPGQGSPTPILRIRCRRSRSRDAQASMTARSPPRWPVFRESRAGFSHRPISPSKPQAGASRWLAAIATSRSSTRRHRRRALP